MMNKLNTGNNSSNMKDGLSNKHLFDDSRFNLSWIKVDDINDISWCVLAWECACSARYHAEHRRGIHSDLIHNIAKGYKWGEIKEERTIEGLERVDAYHALLTLAEHERDLMLRCPKDQIIALVLCEHPIKQARKLYWEHVLPKRWEQLQRIKKDRINDLGLLPWERK